MENDRVTARCAGIYQALAEALAPDGPPAWLALPGQEWPLFESAAHLAPASPAAHRAVGSLAAVPAESVAVRRKRHAALFAGAGCPRIWLYESAHLSQRLLGPETFAVEQFYRAAGLEIASAELPDHASLELSFLAHLVEAGHDSALPYEQQFIKQHAGRWLPQLGRTLARSSDEVYAPIGQLLTDWLEERAGRQVTRRSAATPRLPFVSQPEACSLCGFCVQACPTQALAVHESESETALVLRVSACTGCAKCERICESQALSMKPVRKDSGISSKPGVLRRSPRAACPECGAPTVSHAELNFVITQIGHPAWLDYCLDCRSVSLEAAQ